MPAFPGLAASSASLSNQMFSELVRLAQGRQCAPLHVGDTWLEPPPAVQQAVQGLTGDAFQYAAVRGEQALLEAAAAKLQARSGREVSIDNLQVTAGATSGFAIVSTALLDPGDEVILLSPYWPLIRGILAARGVVARELPCWHRFGDPSYDFAAALQVLCTPRTAAIYVNTPHNPTGKLLPASAVDAIAALVDERKLWLLSDEAYEDLWFGAAPPQPLWAHPALHARSIACHTVSKSYGLAGARIGYVHGPAEAMARIRGVQTFQTYCAPRPMQQAAAAAILHGEAWLAQARAHYAAAGQQAAAALRIAPPEAGTFLFFDTRPYRSPGEDALAFLRRCVEAGVLLTPGASCGADYADWARLCFTCVPPTDLQQALANLGQVLGR